MTEAKRNEKRQIVAIYWRDACIITGKNRDKEAPGAGQITYGAILPKVVRDSYGKVYIRVLNNEGGPGEDDFTDIPKGWIVWIKKIGVLKIEFEL